MLQESTAHLPFAESTLRVLANTNGGCWHPTTKTRQFNDSYLCGNANSTTTITTLCGNYPFCEIHAGAMRTVLNGKWFSAVGFQIIGIRHLFWFCQPFNPWLSPAETGCLRETVIYILKLQQNQRMRHLVSDHEYPLKYAFVAAVFMGVWGN